jgi:ABC-2 type transport system permease protein
MVWIALKTLVRRECRVIARYWALTLAPPIVTTILYFTVFGVVFGTHIGPIDGVEYIRYVVPGLIVLQVVPYSFGHAASGLLGARHFRFVEELLVSPLPGWAVMSGYVIGGAVRGLLVATAAALTMLLFTGLEPYSLLMSATALLLIALVSALGGFVTGMFAKSFDQVSTILALILTPLTYLGGVFGTLTSLPGWARTLSAANPMAHMVSAARYGFLGVSDIRPGTAFIVVCLLGTMLLVASLVLLARGTGLRS